jgi:hypothetical protein
MHGEILMYAIKKIFFFQDIAREGKKKQTKNEPIVDVF